MTPVRFLKGCGLYNRGEVAGFPDDEAARLIADGWAEPADAMDERAAQAAAEEAAAQAEAEAKAKADADAKAKPKV